jgi:hypothetical protein
MHFVDVGRIEKSVLGWGFKIIFTFWSIFLTLQVMKKLLSICIFLLASQLVDAQIYGPYIGASFYGYKSNLFNSDDLRVDSFQKYVITPGFAGSFDYGYLWENGVTFNTGLQIGTSNQKYKGGDTTFPYQFEAQTKLTQVKIPITIGKQTMHGEHKVVLIYSAGLYYAYTASYKDELFVNFTNKNIKDLRYVTEKKTFTEKWDIKDTITNAYVMSRRPYTKHGIGVVANLGIAYRIKEKLDFTVLAKAEFQVTNAEITDQIVYTNAKSGISNPIVPESKHAFGNYAKYMTKANQNHNRSGTHPFNIGLSVGLRYYLFEF